MYHPPSSNYQFSRPPPPPLSLPNQSPQHQTYNLYAGQQQQSNMPPPSPSQTSERDEEANYAHLKGPDPTSRIWDGKAWALVIEQQPIRARMCGFGDKDRRPISPPPCVRLMIFDPKTGKEIDYDKVVDLSRLVLNVDLWNLYGQREDNCVKHSSASPSISSVTTTAYPPTVTSTPTTAFPLQSYNVANMPTYSSQTYSSPTSSAPASASSYGPSGDQPYGRGGSSYPYGDPRYGSQYPNGYAQVSQTPVHQLPPMSALDPLRRSRSSTDMALPETKINMARNLIGSASSTAFKLTDDKGKVGLWFVLQDLSVRTEGWFRLKMNLFNLAEFNLAEDGSSNQSPSPDLLKEAPCLASCFSQPFKVYSAKRFPGVVETTSLSKIFAKQGIKIPIRKDGKDGNQKRKKDESDDDDADDDE